MSPNDGAITALKPYCCRAHGACSREEPQPKFLRVRRIVAPLYRGWLSTKSGFGWRCDVSIPGSPMSLKRHASNRCGPKPVRLMDFRNCFGMIESVSTFSRSSGATNPVWTVNFSILSLVALVPVGRLLDLLAARLDVLAHALDRV